MTLKTAFVGALAYLAFICVMARFLIIFLGDNDDLSGGDDHE